MRITKKLFAILSITLVPTLALYLSGQIRLPVASTILIPTGMLAFLVNRVVNNSILFFDGVQYSRVKKGMSFLGLVAVGGLYVSVTQLGNESKTGPLVLFFVSSLVMGIVTLLCQDEVVISTNFIQKNGELGKLKELEIVEVEGKAEIRMNNHVVVFNNAKDMEKAISIAGTLKKY